MGLRFRKTISILPGVRLNLGKTTSSVSVGVPGFRKTFNTKGQTTTTVGIPGTGLYYVDTKSRKKKTEERKPAKKKAATRAAAPAPQPVQEESAVRPARPEIAVPRRAMPSPESYRRPIQMSRTPAPCAQVSVETLHSIHKYVDDSIDWNEVRALPEPPDPSYNAQMWSYYHEVAPAILEGDIDTYLSVIYEVNPLDDLMDYGSEFTFGTDDASRMEVEFRVNEEALAGLKSALVREEYNDILQDYVCSMVIRIARDIFALLPVESAVVHAELEDETVISVSFDRSTMSKIRFGMIDPSDTLERFDYRMDFTPAAGFRPVNRLEQ